jgi:hypothetical protein
MSADQGLRARINQGYRFLKIHAASVQFKVPNPSQTRRDVPADFLDILFLYRLTGKKGNVFSKKLCQKYRKRICFTKQKIYFELLIYTIPIFFIDASVRFLLLPDL